MNKLTNEVVYPQTNPYYVKPRLADHQFGIKHYAGEVYKVSVCLSIYLSSSLGLFACLPFLIYIFVFFFIGLI